MLDGLQPGCILITFHLLKHLQDNIFPLTDNIKLELQEIKCHKARITELSCGKYYYKRKEGGK